MIADSILLERYIQSKDAKAFTELVRRYAGLVYNTCLRTTSNPQDAEDIAQECFLELARKANRVDSSLPGWLHKVARNRSVDLIHVESRRRVRELKAVTEANDRNEPSWADIMPHVDEALASLPEDLRAVILLYYFERLSQTEIAERLGVSQKTVSRHLDKSVVELRKYLTKIGIVVSSVLLISLLNANTASAAPNSLIISSTKIGLSGIGPSTASRLWGSVARKMLAHKVIVGGASIIVASMLLLPLVHRAGLPDSVGTIGNTSVGNTAGMPSSRPMGGKVIDGEPAQICFSGMPGGSCGARNSTLRFELVGPGRIELYQLTASGRFRVFGTVRVVQTGQTCKNGLIDSNGTVISSE